MPDTLKQPFAPPAEAHASANSKLSPQLQELVRSADFIAWFGDWQGDPQGSQTSKMVDPETGEPQLFYHGTNRQFDISQPRNPNETGFSNHDLDIDGKGVYSTDLEEFAMQYADPLGAAWQENISNLVHKLELKTWSQIFQAWNDIVTSCQQRDGRVTITRSRNTSNPEIKHSFDIGTFERLIAEGKADFADSVELDGKNIMWAGELLQILGGKFPSPQDELAPYKSLYPDARARVEWYESQGGRLLIPAYAEPRIVPVFVKAFQPLEMELRDGSMRSMDSAFDNGFRAIESDPQSSYDAVVTKERNALQVADIIYGKNVAVLSSEQLLEAK